MMHTVRVSHKGQVLIPADIRKHLGITPGCQLHVSVVGNAIRIELERAFPATCPEEGYGMLVCTKPGERRLSDFDVAVAMREIPDDRP